MANLGNASSMQESCLTFAAPGSSGPDQPGQLLALEGVLDQSSDLNGGRGAHGGPGVLHDGVLRRPERPVQTGSEESDNTRGFTNIRVTCGPHVSTTLGSNSYIESLLTPVEKPICSLPTTLSSVVTKPGGRCSQGQVQCTVAWVRLKRSSKVLASTVPGN